MRHPLPISLALRGLLLSSRAESDMMSLTNLGSS